MNCRKKVMTAGKAKKYIGLYFDCEIRHWHYYPLQIIKNIDGPLLVKDIAGVCQELPESDDLEHNDFYYDYIFEKKGDENG